MHLSASLADQQMPEHRRAHRPLFAPGLHLDNIKRPTATVDQLPGCSTCHHFHFQWHQFTARAPVGRCSPLPRRRLCAHPVGSVQISLPARVMRSEPDATPCAQAAQLNVSPLPSSDVDQPPVATHQIDQMCSYKDSAAIVKAAAQ